MYNLQEQNNLPHQCLNQYAKMHDEHTDVVYFNADTGEIIDTAQLKHTRGSNILAKGAYTTHEDSPEHIVVPSDMVDRHDSMLTKISEKAKTEENRIQAVVAKEKLSAGLVESKFTEHPDKDNYPRLAEYSKKHPNFAKTLPYLNEGYNITSDAVQRIGGRFIADGAAIILGGVLYEIKDAYLKQDTIGFKDRIKRLLSTLFNNLKSCFKNVGLKEICFEVINGVFGFFSSLLGNIKSLLKTLGTALHQIWDKIWDYVTGKINSFSKLITIVLQVICDLSITTCTIALDQYLSKQLPFIPEILIGMLSAAFAGVAIVFVNHGIELAIGTIVEIFTGAELAKLHREKVEAFIDEHLKKINEGTIDIEEYAKKFLDNKQEIYEKSFVDVKNSFFVDSYEFVNKINQLGEAFGTEKIPSSYVDDLDAELMAFAKQKHFS